MHSVHQPAVSASDEDPALETPRESRPDHWDRHYRDLGSGGVSWAQQTAAASLDAMSVLGVSRAKSVIDVGGGTSPFAAELQSRGFDDVTVLDISEAALAEVRHRSETGSSPEVVQADLLRWRPRRRYDVWHDRALFHFLTEDSERARYREVLAAALAPSGYVIVEAFAKNGPAFCSGLPVRRYGPVELGDELAPIGLRLECHGHLTHTTPRSVSQEFVWVGLRSVVR